MVHILDQRPNQSGNYFVDKRVLSNILSPSAQLNKWILIISTGPEKAIIEKKDLGGHFMIGKSSTEPSINSY